MCDYYISIFRSKSNNKVHLPLEKGDHPELDTVNFLNTDSI